MWKVVNTAQYTGKVYAERILAKDRIAKQKEKWFREQIPIIARRRNGNTEPRPFPKKHKEAIEEEVQRTPGHPTALDIVPFLDKFGAATFDPMHMLCMGIIPVFYKNIMFVGDRYRKGVQPSEKVPRRGGDGIDGEEGNVGEQGGPEEPFALDEDEPGPLEEDTAEPQDGENLDPRGSSSAAGPPEEAGADGPSVKKPSVHPLLTPKQRDVLHDLMAEVSPHRDCYQTRM